MRRILVVWSYGSMAFSSGGLASIDTATRGTYHFEAFVSERLHALGMY